jgi:gamma-glutamyltranspeptidase/glutathione hydrolase
VKNILYSDKKVVFAKNGMVATSEPQAAQAGLDILRKGGNAIDAAIAVAACLTVTEPTSNGIGGDNFAIVWHNHQIYGLNSSGTSPESLTFNELKNNGLKEIPKYGFFPVTVPGAVQGWIELSKKFGKLPLKEVLKPAINYARNGFVVGHTISKNWKQANQIYQKNLQHEMYKYWFETFTKDLNAPKAGDLYFLKDHANTLEEIADTMGYSFYHGNIANQIEQFSKKYGGYIRKSDLENFKSIWVDPISIDYRGHQIWELPPNGQGIVALMALNIAENFKYKEKNLVSTYHKQIEALKLAFADGINFISDIDYMKTPIQSLLSKNYAWNRAKEIQNKAIEPKCGKPIGSGTVYLATADQDGNMVSMIQSNYMGFGSGLVVPNTGIALHNRGHNFSLDPKSSNVLAPNKRPYHTIIPGFITKDLTPIGPFGVMGGFMQPQGHLQVVMNLLDFNMDPQEALDYPRWQWIESKKILVEKEMPLTIINGLIKKGHDVTIEENISSFGRGQIIMRNPHSFVYSGGTEKRCDGTIAAY